MSAITLTQPETAALTAKLTPLIRKAQAVAIIDQASHGAAQEIIRTLTLQERAVKQLFAEPKADAHRAHKSITAAEKRLLDPISEAKRIVNNKATVYEMEQRRKAEAEQRRLEAEAREREEARRLEEAIAAEAAGDVEVAEQILSEPEPPPPVIHVAPAVAKVEGMSTQTRWHAEVVDKPALIRWVAEHPEFADYLEPNMPALNARARSAQKALAIPGVRPVGETTRMVRG